MSNIDWSKLITREMKEATVAAQLLTNMQAELAARNVTAAEQIGRIQDRVDTLGYGVDSGEASTDDEAELAALSISLKAWKGYKFQLGKVTTQSGWPASPIWPQVPTVPEITADPASVL